MAIIVGLGSKHVINDYTARSPSKAPTLPDSVTSLADSGLAFDGVSRQQASRSRLLIAKTSAARSQASKISREVSALGSSAVGSLEVARIFLKVATLQEAHARFEQSFGQFLRLRRVFRQNLLFWQVTTIVAIRGHLARPGSTGLDRLDRARLSLLCDCSSGPPGLDRARLNFALRATRLDRLDSICSSGTLVWEARLCCLVSPGATTTKSYEIHPIAVHPSPNSQTSLSVRPNFSQSLPNCAQPPNYPAVLSISKGTSDPSRDVASVAFAQIMSKTNPYKRRSSLTRAPILAFTRVCTINTPRYAGSEVELISFLSNSLQVDAPVPLCRSRKAKSHPEAPMLRNRASDGICTGPDAALSIST